MARALRIEYEGAVYHVTSRGNERKNIFFTKIDYQKFKEYLSESQEKFHFKLHCYVLMTNHYHLLLQTPERNLQRAMHYINSSFSMYTNTKRKRCGHLFQGRYKALIVDKDSYLVELSRYIHLNPVRAKMVERPEDYPYSSYPVYVSGSDDGLVSSAEILKVFGDQPATARTKYRAFVEIGLQDEIESPLTKVYGGSFLGSEDFAKDVLGNLPEESLDDEDIANRKSLRPSVQADVLMAQLADYLQVPIEMVTKERKLSKVTVYLLKKHSDATNKQIGEMLSHRSFSTASKTYGRFIKEMEQDQKLKREVKAIEQALSLVKR